MSASGLNDVSTIHTSGSTITTQIATAVATHSVVTVQLRRRGAPFVRLVAAAFDAYLGRGTARHSRAV